MDDQVGLIVMLGIVVLLVVGLVMVTKQRSGKRGGDGTESLNHHVTDTVQARSDHPEGAERSHLVGNPPVDTVTTEGWGVATPGEGALPELPEDVHPDLHDSDRKRRRP
jgi:hypothetical protein